MTASNRYAANRRGPHRHPLRGQRWIFYTLSSILLVAAGLWNGLIPLSYIPYASLDLNRPDSWFIDFRLAAMKLDHARCLSALTEPVISAQAVADVPYENGCGWRNAFSVTNAGGARVAIEHMTCDLAAAFAMWMAHEVQPAAATYLNNKVKSVQHMGVYSCRNILGSKTFASFRSQHARANAIDVSAFVLEDGRTISVAKSWKGDSAEAKFLHYVHSGACRYFRVTLGPSYNAAHANHFHLDRGAFRTCK